jgi:hypothetical protein
MSALYPCEPWPIDPRCCPAFPDDPAEWTDAHREAQYLATITLWRAVAGAIGLCRTTEAPCMDRCSVTSPYETAWMYPYRDVGGVWRNSTCGCRDTCSCTRLCTVTLQGPVWQIVEVKAKGEVVPSDAYKVLTGSRLARCGGCWPSCQDYCDETGVVVTYLRGRPPGPDAVRAVSALACKKFEECNSAGGDCGSVPSGTTSISREGLNIRLDGTVGASEGGMVSMTGIGWVDAWIAQINPYGITQQPAVYSPDVETPLIWRNGPVIV